MNCWTCGEEIPEEKLSQSPHEKSDPTKVMCLPCHFVIDSAFDPLHAMNMVRFAAGVPVVKQL